MPNFEDSYVGRLRKLDGSRKLILPGPRAAITDDQSRLLLIRRSDNHEWAMPAGMMELEESVYGCPPTRGEGGDRPRRVIRYTVRDLLRPAVRRVDGWGNHFQHLAFAFHVDEWAGTLLTATDETVDARFFRMDGLPDITDHRLECVRDLRAFDERLILK